MITAMLAAFSSAFTVPSRFMSCKAGGKTVRNGSNLMSTEFDYFVGMSILAVSISFPSVPWNRN